MPTSIRVLLLACAVLLTACPDQPPQDPLNAAHDRKCQAGDAESCYQLARYHVGKEQPTSASNAYEKSCKGGHVAACYEGAYFVADTQRFQPDYERGAPMHRKACNAGYADSCRTLGWFHEQGNITKSTRRALALYRKGCEGRDGLACGLLGERYRDGKHVGRDRGMAASFFRKGCKYDDATSCTGLAEHYAVGWGVQRNASEAVELLQKGCKLGDKFACNVLTADLLARDGDATRTKAAWKRLAAADSARALFRRPPRTNEEAIKRIDNVRRAYADIACNGVDAELATHIRTWPSWAKRAMALCAEDERRQRDAQSIATFAGLVGAALETNESGDRDGTSMERGMEKGQSYGRLIARGIVGETSQAEIRGTGAEAAALLRDQHVLRMRLQVRYGLALPVPQ